MRKVFLIVLFSFILITPVYAHCPLCAAATGAAVATARFYGVDDTITGTFVGAFIIATGLWMNNMLKKRKGGKNYFSFQTPAILALSFALMLVSLYFVGLLHLDKLLAGTIGGTIITLVAFGAHHEFRKINKNHNYVPMQGILLPFLFLIAFNLCLYLFGMI